MLDYSYVNKSQTYSVASAPDMTGSVFMRRFKLFLACVAGILAKNASQPDLDPDPTFQADADPDTKFV